MVRLFTMTGGTSLATVRPSNTMAMGAGGGTSAAAPAGSSDARSPSKTKTAKTFTHKTFFLTVNFPPKIDLKSGKICRASFQSLLNRTLR
jgi:hypothetical protein